MNNITAFDVYEFLPAKIQELLFSQYMDDTMENIYSIANIPSDKQVLLHRDVVSVLIGKYEVKQLEELLKSTYGLTDNLTTVVINFLNSRVFQPAQLDIRNARVVYLQAEKEGVESFNSGSNTEIPAISNPKPEKLVSYIQELASSLKDKPIIERPKEEIKEEVVVKEVEVEEAEPVMVEEKIVEETEPEPKKESILLQAMLQHQTGTEGKLNEYYKALKDNLDVKVEEKENVFQPPFRSVKGRGALVESSADENAPSAFDSNVDKDIKKEEPEESFREPIKYNSFNYLKKEKESGDAPKAETKFIDLGDFD